jgi:hypothetical protein
VSLCLRFSCAASAFTLHTFAQENAAGMPLGGIYGSKASNGSTILSRRKQLPYYLLKRVAISWLSVLRQNGEKSNRWVDFNYQRAFKSLDYFALKRHSKLSVDGFSGWCGRQILEYGPNTLSVCGLA